MTGERQVATTIDGICKGHVNRYKFAAKHATGKILDAACGVGYGSSLLKGDVTGIDLEEEAIRYANKFWQGPKYLVGDVLTHTGEYDWIVSFETIEHVPEDKKCLDNFRRIGQNLVISTPNSEGYPFRPESYANDRFPHVRHYSPKEFESALNASGWGVVERHHQPKKKGEVEDGIGGMFLIYVCR